MRRKLVAGNLVLALAVALACVACGDIDEVSGVYIERFGGPVPETRLYALRLTVFEFADDVGGFVEYYEQDGLNSPENPYVSPTSCAYFGRVRRFDSGFRLEAAGVEGADEVLRIEADRRSRDRLVGEILLDGGVVADDASAEDPAFDAEFVTDEGRPVVAECPQGIPVLVPE